MNSSRLDLGTSWEWSAPRPGRFTAGERAPDTHWIAGWVGPTTGLDDADRREKRCLYRDSKSDPSAGQPVARCYIECATPVFRRRSVQISIWKSSILTEVFLSPLRKMSGQYGSNFNLDIIYPDWSFWGFPQSSKENVQIVRLKFQSGHHPSWLRFR
jgi:hypothetical protein